MAMAQVLQNEPMRILIVEDDDLQAQILDAILTAAGFAVDVIAGGFPCQDISIANVGWGEARGLDGERSGLFFHMARIIRELRPRAVVMENVSALLNR